MPTAAPYAGADATWPPTRCAQLQTAPAPLVLPQPTFSGAPELATPPFLSCARHEDGRRATRRVRVLPWLRALPRLLPPQLALPLVHAY